MAWSRVKPMLLNIPTASSLTAKAASVAGADCRDSSGTSKSATTASDTGLQGEALDSVRWWSVGHSSETEGTGQC